MNIMTEKQKTRAEIPAEHTWDLSPLFENDEAWERAFARVDAVDEPLEPLRGKLAASADNLAAALRIEDDVAREIERLYAYVHLRADEDTANATCAAMKSRTMSKIADLSARLSWIRPEILAIPDERLDELTADSAMAPYGREMELIRRDKPHTLSEKEERLLSLAAEPLGTAAQAFSMLSNADLTFPAVKNEKGAAVELTHGNFITFQESRDRAVRAAAFGAMYDTYETVKNTLAATLDGDTRKRIFNARVRNFESAMAASLHDDNVEPAVYDGLIAAVRGGFPAFNRYIDLRRRQLGIEKLDIYDLYVPIVPDFDMTVPWEQAQEWVRQAVEPLGEEYCRVVDRAFSERWIDVYENRGKRSGAYSSGCYDSPPYMLMNYQPTLSSAFTLAHELGHSLHSWFSNSTRSHLYAEYRILVAEVASTVNEGLLLDYLLQTADDPRLRAYLLHHVCNGFRGTVFRQTMFAEFEKEIHRIVEDGGALTADVLSEHYRRLVDEYHGPGVAADERIGREWARIPHFYYNFYVYKYATGYAAAQAFCARILSGDSAAVDRYRGFLKAGCGKDPLDILADAGVDLRDPAVVAGALDTFGKRTDELAASLEMIDSNDSGE